MFTPHWQLGLSFTNHHARLAVFDGKKLVACAGAELPTPFEQMKAGSPQDLAAVIAQLREQCRAIDGHRDVVVALGDEAVFTRILTLPALSGKETREAAPHELESDLPLKSDQIYVDLYELRPLPDGKREYMAFAVNRQLVDWLIEGLQLARLRPKSIETVSLALGRLQTKFDQPYLTVDVGSDYASMAVFSGGLMHVNTSVAMHDAGWSALVNEPTPQLTADDLVAKFSRLFADLVENIQATIRYFQNRAPDQAVAAVFLSGSGAHVPHLDTYLNGQLQLPVRVNRPEIASLITPDSSYLPAIGAAIYGH